MSTPSKKRPTGMSHARKRANHEVAQTAALAELAVERRAAGVQSQKLRKLRLAQERKAMVLAAAAKHAS